MLETWATSKRASVAIIAICQVAAMALWFSASAVTPALAAEFHLSNFSQAALTSGVQAGFVLGCVASAILGLPDRVDSRRLFAAWQSIDEDAISRAAEMLEAAIRGGHFVYSCGNGGSAAIANHLQCDFLKGAQTDTELQPRVVSLSCARGKLRRHRGCAPVADANSGAVYSPPRDTGGTDRAATLLTIFARVRGVRAIGRDRRQRR